MNARKQSEWLKVSLRKGLILFGMVAATPLALAATKVTAAPDKNANTPAVPAVVEQPAAPQPLAPPAPAPDASGPMFSP